MPYIGAVVVTVPVFDRFSNLVLTALWILMTVYALIQVIDGNVLVLFFFRNSELTPVAIIIAVLAFGVGGFGVCLRFIGTLLKAVIGA